MAVAHHAPVRSRFAAADASRTVSKLHAHAVTRDEADRDRHQLLRQGHARAAQRKLRWPHLARWRIPTCVQINGWWLQVRSRFHLRVAPLEPRPTRATPK